MSAATQQYSNVRPAMPAATALLNGSASQSPQQTINQMYNIPIKQEPAYDNMVST